MTEEKGFSLVEALIVVAVGALIIGVGLPTMEGSLRQARADAAMNTVMTQLRLARQSAVDQRRVHRVILTAPNWLKVERQETGGAWTTLSDRTLPPNFAFRVEPGLPTATEETPDKLGASEPFSFNGEARVFFRPEGAAVDSTGAPANGIVYLSQSGHLDTARSVSLFGATGRIKAWTYRQNGESEWSWQE